LLGRAQVLVARALAVWAGPAGPHESRPAYLEIRETAASRYHLLWRTPVLSGMLLPVVLELPEGITATVEPVVQMLPDSRLERRKIEAEDGLAGARLSFVGLEATITDVSSIPSGATVAPRPRSSGRPSPSSCSRRSRTPARCS